MKAKLKLKVTVILSVSILLNIFLLWEVQRKTNLAKKLEKEVTALKSKLPALLEP